MMEWGEVGDGPSLLHIPIHLIITFLLWSAYGKSTTGGVWISNGIAHYSHGYHMHTTWISHVHLMGITCTPHGYQMRTSNPFDNHIPAVECLW